MASAQGKGNTAVACIIMASGFGRRFGGNKLLANFRGSPLISAALTATNTPLIAQRAVVTRYAGVQRLCLETGVPCLRHDELYQNDTVRLGLSYLSAQVDAPYGGYLFCNADQPLLHQVDIETIIHCWQAEPDCICRAAAAGHVGNPILFPAALLSELLTLPKDSGGNVLLKKHRELIRLVELAPTALADIDTPEDLAIWQK